MRAEDVASYFLSKTDPNREINFTNMMLQKHLLILGPMMIS